MGSHRRLITGVLTSSRADYGIYLPLLKALRQDGAFDLRLLVFGTHLSEKFGMTVRQIEADGFEPAVRVETLPAGDAPGDISLSMAKTMEGFTPLWRSTHFDLIFALGDRYEMFAAVASTVPFNIPIAHIHGGETTSGAIDDAFRHAISCMSSLHFTSTETYKERVLEITGKTGNVFNTGALSVDTIMQTKLLAPEEFKHSYHIDLSGPAILVTFHPETIDPDKNQGYTEELIRALDVMPQYRLVVTMPNADTEGLQVRNALKAWGEKKENVHLVESFGSAGYLSCMKHCTMMLGNTSSGFVEAAYFSKPVINLGERQKGRLVTPNIINVPVEAAKILEAVKTVEKARPVKVAPVYGTGGAAGEILAIVKKKFNLK